MSNIIAASLRSELERVIKKSYKTCGGLKCLHDVESCIGSWGIDQYGRDRCPCCLRQLAEIEQYRAQVKERERIRFERLYGYAPKRRF